MRHKNFDFFFVPPNQLLNKKWGLLPYYLILAIRKEVGHFYADHQIEAMPFLQTPFSRTEVLGKNESKNCENAMTQWQGICHETCRVVVRDPAFENIPSLTFDIF